MNSNFLLIRLKIHFFKKLKMSFKGRKNAKRLSIWEMASSTKR